MRPVEPKAFFLAETKLVLDDMDGDDDRLPGVRSWLQYIGGDEAEACLEHMSGSDLEQLIELLGRRCYKSFAVGLNPNITKIRTDSEKYHENVIKSRHGSVFAHGHCTYGFEGVSRVFTHEVVRNSTGNDISQESLRYVRLDDISFWIPPIIANNKNTTLDPPSEEIERFGLTGKLTPREITASDVFQEVIWKCEWAQRRLAEIYKIDEMKDFAEKKKLTSAFRRVAPEGLATGIGMTFQMRSLRWIVEQRTDPAAEEEIRIVMGQVARDAISRWPMLFQDFVAVDTGDGLVWYRPVHSKI